LPFDEELQRVRHCYLKRVSEEGLASEATGFRYHRDIGETLVFNQDGQLCGKLEEPTE